MPIHMSSSPSCTAAPLNYQTSVVVVVVDDVNDAVAAIVVVAAVAIDLIFIIVVVVVVVILVVVLVFIVVAVASITIVHDLQTLLLSTPSSPRTITLTLFDTTRNDSSSEHYSSGSTPTSVICPIIIIPLCVIEAHGLQE